MHKAAGQQVFRARFSAITAPEIRAAMVNSLYCIMPMECVAQQQLIDEYAYLASPLSLISMPVKVESTASLFSAFS